MSASLQRARRPNSLAASLVELLNDYGFPLPTHAVRIILTDRGRPVTAEHLASLSAYERTSLLRTRVPPRLCSVIDAEAYAITPRWWARGDWRLQRRIQTDDAKQLWQARLADRLCIELASRQTPPAPEEITRLAFETITKLGLECYFDVPCSSEDWMTLRGLVVNAHPSQSIDGPTEDQYHAEQRLKAASLPAVDLYFGRQRE